MDYCGKFLKETLNFLSSSSVLLSTSSLDLPSNWSSPLNNEGKGAHGAASLLSGLCQTASAGPHRERVSGPKHIFYLLLSALRSKPGCSQRGSGGSRLDAVRGSALGDVCLHGDGCRRHCQMEAAAARYPKGGENPQTLKERMICFGGRISFVADFLKYFWESEGEGEREKEKERETVIG